jgi:hypothetical protein
MKSKQLEIFNKIPTDKLNQLIFEVLGRISVYKHQALHIEISIGRERPFMFSVEMVRLFCELGQILCQDSPKYRHLKEKEWKSKSRYEPYYAALEPRSAFNLGLLSKDNKSRSKAILLRFRGILDMYGEPVQQLLEKIDKNDEKIYLELKKIYSTSGQSQF